jgi:hypothetical protein
MLPGLIRGWQTLTTVLNLSTVALGMSVIGLTALVAAAGVAYDIVTRLTNAKNEATDADYAAFESNQKLGQKLREVADAAGLTRAEFHQLSLKYDDNNAAMAMAIKRGTEGKALQEALAKVGKEHAAAIDAQKAAQEKANPLTAAAAALLAEADAKTKALADSLENKLKPALDLSGSLNDFSDGVRGEFADLDVASGLAAKTLREQFAAAGDGAEYDMEGALAKIADGWKKVPDGAKAAAETTKSIWQECSTVIADSMKEIAKAIVGLFNFKGLFGAVAIDIKFDSSAFDAMVAAANSAFDAVKSAIESSVDALKAATEKEIDLIKVKYDKMIDAAKSAYDKVADAAKASFDKAEESARAAFDKIEKNIKAAYDAFEEAARAAYDAVEARISRQQSIEDRARSWHDTFEDRAISRQQEREDRAFSRQYEKEREAIENSKMTRAEKDAALAALARKYEHEQDVREMKRQHEADVRQRAREHADLVRELARERAKEARERAYNKAKEARELAYDKAREAREKAYDKAKEARERAYERAKEARERAFQLKLEGIRAKQAAAEEAARVIARAKEAELMAALLAAQTAHQTDLDGIRTAENLARQAQADKEETRQGSLWFKVKGIFATACESMATIFLTEMLTGPGSVGETIAKLAKKLIGKGKGELGKTFDDVGGNVKGLGTTIGEFISGIGAGIGGFISGLATGVGLAITMITGAIAGAIVALATGIATAAGILVAALPDLMLIAAAALAIYAGFTIVKGLVDKIFGKKMDTGPMEYWLKLLWELTQNSYNFLIGPLTWFMNEVKNAVSTEVVPTLWHINEGIGAAVAALYHISTKVDTSTGYLRTSMGYLKTIADTIVKLPIKAAIGTASTILTGRKSEYAVPAPNLQSFANRMTPAMAAPTGQSGTPINLTFNVNAIDRAGIETFLRRDARPILQRMLANLELRPVAAGIGG